MSEETIIKHCSPTLAGIKTANMFSCTFESNEQMNSSIKKWNRILVKKGLRMLPLRFRDNKGLIYLYRPSRLYSDLKDSTACRLLEERGYGEKPEHCVLKLIKRLAECEEFPHEIGLFLGYPPEDVCGFIEKGANGCKCVGCWRVYGDDKSAKKTFERYKKCTTLYSKLIEKGRSIERLTVAG